MKTKTELLKHFFIDKDNLKIEVKKEFAAPLSQVWTAWTESELLDRWWAPKPWTAQTKYMDFREGGYWIYAMVGPDGTTHWSRADFISITPLKSFKGIDAFCDEHGKIDAALPTSAWTVHFNETNDLTTMVSIEIKYYQAADMQKYIEMGFREGFMAALDNLSELLE